MDTLLISSGLFVTNSFCQWAESLCLFLSSRSTSLSLTNLLLRRFRSTEVRLQSHFDWKVSRYTDLCQIRLAGVRGEKKKDFLPTVYPTWTADNWRHGKTDLTVAENCPRHVCPSVCQEFGKVGFKRPLSRSSVKASWPRTDYTHADI